MSTSHALPSPAPAVLVAPVELVVLVVLGILELLGMLGVLGVLEGLVGEGEVEQAVFRSLPAVDALGLLLGWVRVPARAQDLEEERVAGVPEVAQAQAAQAPAAEWLEGPGLSCVPGSWSLGSAWLLEH